MTFYSNPKQQYVLTPRAKPLYDDSNRFGTKMLEKMGWSKGKGLGPKLEGQQDFIKISVKSNQVGIGFEDRNDQWTQHESNFTELLDSFKTHDVPADIDDEPTAERQCTGFGFASKKPAKTDNFFSGVSLEEQSKKSRARVHYKKFTRGKDMSRYTEKDLANIFGRKELVQDLPKLEAFVALDEDDTSEKPKNKFGVDTIETSTSIEDYFRAKMAALKQKKMGNGNDTKPLFNNGNLQENLSVADNPSIETPVESDQSTKKKSKKAKRDKQDVVLDEPEVIKQPEKKSKKAKKNQTEPIVVDEPAEETKQNLKRSKKTKQKNVDESEIVFLDKPASEIQQSDKKSKKAKLEVVVLNDLTKDVEISEKKSKKAKKNITAECEIVILDEPAREIQQSEKKSKKANKNHSNVVVLDEPTEEIQKSKKKTKKSKINDLEMPIEIVDVSTIMNEKVAIKFSQKLKKDSVALPWESAGNLENAPISQSETAKELVETSYPLEAIKQNKITDDMDQTSAELSDKIEAFKKNKKKKLTKRKETDNVEDKEKHVNLKRKLISEPDSNITELKKVKGSKSKDCDETEVKNNISILKFVLNLCNAATKPTMPVVETPKPLDNTQMQPPLKNEYLINNYKAEIFRFFDLDGYKNSSLPAIQGYQFNSETSVKISTKHTDAAKIKQFWDNCLNRKYETREPLQKITKAANLTKRKERLELRSKSVFETI